MVLRLLENAFMSQKIESFHFYSCPKQTFLYVLIITYQTKRNYPFPKGSVLWKFIFPQHKGENEDIMELRKRPKLNLRGWFKHAKCEGFNLTNIILTKKYSVKE